MHVWCLRPAARDPRICIWSAFPAGKITERWEIVVHKKKANPQIYSCHIHWHWICSPRALWDVIYACSDHVALHLYWHCVVFADLQDKHRRANLLMISICTLGGSLPVLPPFTRSKKCIQPKKENLIHCFSFFLPSYGRRKSILGPDNFFLGGGVKLFYAANIQVTTNKSQ